MDNLRSSENSEEYRYIDEELKPMQQIEGGGGPKKVHLQSMPKPIRYFGYFFVFIVPILLISLVIISFIR